MADEAFQPLPHLQRYTHDGAARLQAYLRQFPAYAEVVIAPLDFLVSSRLLPTATSAQWALVQDIQRAAPDARVLLRERTFAWTRGPKAPKLRTVTVLVLKKVGPIALRREFVVPDA
jgi:hypothetical protein